MWVQFLEWKIGEISPHSPFKFIFPHDISASGGQSGQCQVQERSQSHIVVVLEPSLCQLLEIYKQLISLKDCQLLTGNSDQGNMLDAVPKDLIDSQIVLLR